MKPADEEPRGEVAQRRLDLEMVFDTGPGGQPTRTSSNQCCAHEAYPIVVLKVGIVTLILLEGGEASSFSETARPLVWTEVVDVPAQPLIYLQKQVSNSSIADRAGRGSHLVLPEKPNFMLAQPLEPVIVLITTLPIPALA